MTAPCTVVEVLECSPVMERSIIRGNRPSLVEREIADVALKVICGSTFSGGRLFGVRREKSICRQVTLRYAHTPHIGCTYLDYSKKAS